MFYQRKMMLCAAFISGVAVAPGYLLAAQPDLPVAIKSPLTANGAVAVEGGVTILNQEVREPFQTSRLSDYWSDKYHSFTIGVPEGKRLVVQTVSFSAEVEPGQKVKAQLVSQGAGLAAAINPVVMTFQGNFNGNDLYVGSMSGISYAGGSGGIYALIGRTSDVGAGGEVRVTVAGYLVNLE